MLLKGIPNIYSNLTCILESACSLDNILQLTISLLPQLSKHSYSHTSIRRLESCCLRAVELPIVPKQLHLTCEECDCTANTSHSVGIPLEQMHGHQQCALSH